MLLLLASVLILIGFFGIGYHFGKKSMKRKGRYNRKDTGNIFMNMHNYSEYINDQYEWYLDLCKMENKSPMLIDQFKSEIKTNRKLQEQFNGLGINMFSGK
ncbi:hypothetical protein [Epilithonimonas sp. UC225_85]|uniref:hypothetical protein n=1 Tax=Epilithonimonas sp. UC225_85 TaxID=3350167 RepID=UPI0036D3D8A7